MFYYFADGVGGEVKVDKDAEYSSSSSCSSNLFYYSVMQYYIQLKITISNNKFVKCPTCKRFIRHFNKNIVKVSHVSFSPIKHFAQSFAEYSNTAVITH